MTVSKETILTALAGVKMPDAKQTIIEADIVRAVNVEAETVRFILEVSPDIAPDMEPVQEAAEAAIRALDGVSNVQVIVTAHGPAEKPPAPSLKIGRHATPQAGPQDVAGVKNVIAIASGKGGVGKSTVSANLAIAFNLLGRKVGLLDADVYGPSQPRMMGVSTRPQTSDGKTILPPSAHGVTLMSLGLMVKEGEAVIWRGPMLMGALQQMMGQVAWGDLDILLVDLPPGTGDVQLTLSQKYNIKGAIVVSTPQDVALIDARKALDMFAKTNIPVLGMIENMSRYICPSCGHQADIFGHGGARADAERFKLPFLGEIPLELEVRTSGDQGLPVVAGHPDGPAATAFRQIAQRLIESEGL